MSGKTSKNPVVQVFISHLHVDEDLACALVDVVKTVTGLEDKAILCTSSLKHGLGIGAALLDQLRNGVRHAKIVFCIFSPDVRRSDYVTFELGAAWGAKPEKIWLLLVNGATKENIPEPLRNRLFCDLQTEDGCRRFVHDLSEAFGRDTAAAGQAPEVVAKMSSLREFVTKRIAKRSPVKVTASDESEEIRRFFSVNGPIRRLDFFGSTGHFVETALRGYLKTCVVRLFVRDPESDRLVLPKEPE